MPNSHLHDGNDFRKLINTVGLEQRINDPVLVEKDYWIDFTSFAGNSKILFGL